MLDFLARIFDTSDFPARWNCGHWTAAHGYLHIFSDLAVWSAYVAIPCVLGYFILKRSDLPFRKIFVLFGAFILACGTTHLMEAMIFYWPAYRLAGVIKLFTGIVSWATVIALVPVVPKVLKLRSPEELEREIAARAKIENELHQTNSELEKRVEALRSSEERFRLLVEGTKDYSMFLLDKSGHVATWNSGAQRIKQYRAEEIIGQHFSRFYSSEDIRAGRPQHDLQVAVAQGKYEEEGWRLRKDGTQFFASVIITALRDDSGNLRGFSKITRDVTEKKEAEATASRLLSEAAARKAADELARVIYEQRERLQVTLASIGDAVISTDAEARVTFVNAVAEQLTGWKFEEANGLPLETVFNIVNEQTRQPVENPVVRAVRDGVVVGLANHTTLISKDGTERPIDDSAAPIRDSTGEILGSVLVFRDVTNQRRTETMNRLLAEVSGALVGPLHYQSILREVAELTVPTLGDFCFFDVMTGDQQLDRVGWKHVDPTMAGLAEKVRRFAPSIGATNHPVLLVLQSGQAEIIPEVTDEWLQSLAINAEHLAFLRGLNIGSVLFVPMVVGDRRIGVLTFAYNKSRRRHTPAEMSLAQEIARRAALTVENAKLFDQLHDADQKKTEFLAILAHELRNPLAPITNALQIMRMTGSRGEDTASLRDMMERQVRQMVHLVDDLLDVSRITSGKIVLRRERLDLAEAVHSALETSRTLIEAAKHELTVTVPPQSHYVEGDKTRLAQVLSNLLSNAVKYTPDHGRIWLTVTRDQQEAVIRVQDTGVGIPAEMLSKIFDMFTQVDRNLGRSQGGLGIGLTLVRNLVAMHGGTIEAHSDGPGQGSEFVVRLPLAPDETALQTGQTKQDAGPKTGPSPQWRVLVVDDNTDSAESLGKLLRTMGHEIHVSYDGLSALDAAVAFRPDLVMLDIGLPGISGYDVARRMRQIAALKNTILVAQTGWGQDEDKRRSVEAGFDAHMVKPVDAGALQTLLEELARKRM